MKRYAAIVLIAASGTLAGADPLPLDAKQRSLTVAGYTFQKSYDEPERQWTFRATKDGQVVRNFGNPEPNELSNDESHLSIGMVKAVSGDTGQVVMQLWTGGAKCCRIHWIVGFTPELRVLLDTSPYGFDAMDAAGDMDGDGDWEFSFGTSTFDYFDAAYAYSPRADAWFKFHRTSGSFTPANDLCFPEVEKRIQTNEAKLRAAQLKQRVAPDNQEFRQIVLNITLAYLYAGRERQAWSFFDREYREPDREQLKDKVERKANGDPFFRAFINRTQRR